MSGTLANLFLLPALLSASASPACGQIEFVSSPAPQRVFAGGIRQFTVTWHNPGQTTASLELHARLYETTSATAVLLTETTQRTLRILPGQTVLDSEAIAIPAVTAETPFLIQWHQSTTRVLGKSLVLAYPPDLLKALGNLAGGQPLGVFDPQNALKSLIKSNSVAVSDLEENGVAAFAGKLAIIGPFRQSAEVPRSLPASLKTLASRGAGVVWIQPPPEGRPQLAPTFYTVLEGRGAVVVVQPELVANLSDSPESQLNLVHLANLAMTPRLPGLPGVPPDPRL